MWVASVQARCDDTERDPHTDQEADVRVEGADFRQRRDQQVDALSIDEPLNADDSDCGEAAQ